MLEVIAEKLLESAVGAAIEAATERIIAKRSGGTRQDPASVPRFVSITAPRTNARLLQHLKDLRKWSSTISFADLRAKRRLTDVYLELDTYVTPVRQHLDPIEKTQAVPILAALQNSDTHVVVLGQPGAGKTTTVQKICADFFAKDKLLLNYNFPIVVRLREAKRSEHLGPVFLALATTLGLEITIPDAQSDGLPSELMSDSIESAVCRMLDGLRVAVILDGFDEIPDPADKSAALQDVRRLSRELTHSRLILTSRSGDFPYHIEGACTLEISPLSTEQIEGFSRRWLRDSANAGEFVRQVLSSPFADTAMRPLTLAHLCAIYERVGSVPDKPKTVYRKVIGLLLEDWDAQRSVRRATAYSKFEADRKFELLCHLAYVLTCEYRASVFSADALTTAYQQICGKYRLPLNQAEEVARELESHTGLFLESGFQSYEFAHKSLQEYLAAEYMVRLPSLSAAEAYLSLIPAELALAVAISSDPTQYFSTVVLRWFPTFSPSSEYARSFASRMQLEKIDLEPTAESRLAACYLTALIGSRDFEPFFGQLTVGASNTLGGYYRKGKHLYDKVRCTLRRPHPDFPLPRTLQVPSWLLLRTDA